MSESPGMTPAEELASVAALMTEHRLDSVEMPSGLKVLKTMHVLPETSAPPDVVEAAVARRLEAMGVMNATEESGRVPLEQDEVMFAASHAPALDLSDFRPQSEAGDPTDGSDQ